MVFDSPTCKGKETFTSTFVGGRLGKVQNGQQTITGLPLPTFSRKKSGGIGLFRVLEGYSICCEAFLCLKIVFNSCRSFTRSTACQVFFLPCYIYTLHI